MNVVVSFRKVARVLAEDGCCRDTYLKDTSRERAYVPAAGRIARRCEPDLIFNLPGYRVIDAVDIVRRSRRVRVVSTEPPGCPGCGVISTRVHQRTRQRVGDVPLAGAVEVIWCKRRWICAEDLCAKVTFAESTIDGSFTTALLAE